MFNPDCQIFHFDEIASTQETAWELWDAAKGTSFAVVAASQTGGRGQRGHQWNSPKGNLYLSLVMQDPGCRAEQVTLLPLKVGRLVADWIFEQYGVSVTGKWPNDLLFAGRKLAGILCESRLCGSALEAVVVGVGLNLNVTPDLPATTSLLEISGKQMQPGDSAGTLLQYLAAHWQRYPTDDLSWLSERPPEVWRFDAKTFISERVSERGAMEVKELHLPENRRTIDTAAHQLTWAYGDPLEIPLAVMDVGNTRAKLGIFTGRRQQEPEAFLSLDPGNDLKTELAKLQKLAPESPLHIASVNAQNSDAVQQACAAIGWPVLAISKRWLRAKSSYPAAQIGIDRLAAIEGYLGARPSQPAIILLLGTATTFDLVDAAGKHRGGWIVPGLQSALDSLNRSTDQLPALTVDSECDFSAEALGMNTTQAMQKGALFATIGQLEWLHRYAREELGLDAPEIIAAGGFAGMLGSMQAQAKPYVILQGLKELVIT